MYKRSWFIMFKKNCFLAFICVFALAGSLFVLVNLNALTEVSSLIDSCPSNEGNTSLMQASDNQSNIEQHTQDSELTRASNIYEEDEGVSYVANKVVVSFANPSISGGYLNNEAKELLKKSEALSGLDGVVKQINDYQCVLDVAQGYTVSNAVAQLNRLDDIEFADADWIFTLADDEDASESTQSEAGLSASLTNDPYLNNQWALTSNSQSLASAWSQVKANKQVSVATLDTGIQSNHPDLKNNIMLATNVVADGFGAEDRQGHGTHVAGIISAESDNGIGISGVTYNAGLVSVRVFREVANNWTAYSSDIAMGVEKVISLKDTYNIKVINMSLGIENTSRSNPPSDAGIMASVINKAHDAGITICAASGNESSETELVPCSFPSYLDYCIAVGSIDDTLTRSEFSNGDESLDVVAPGGTILSTMNNSNYANLSGTSMATPFVSGIAALCYAINPSITPDQVKSSLTTTATDLGSSGFDTLYGYGLVDPNASISAARNAKESTTSTLNYSTNGDVQGTITISDDKGNTYATGSQVTYGRYLTLSWDGIKNSASDGTITMITSVTKNGSTIYSSANIDKTSWQSVNTYWRSVYKTNTNYVTFDTVNYSVEAGGTIDLGQVDTDVAIVIKYTKLQPIYRLYNSVTSEHLFTTSKSEYDNFARLCLQGNDFWIPEGIDWFAYYSQNSNSSPVYRLYNAGLGSLGRNSHYYTSDLNEAFDLTTNSGWTYDTFDGGNLCFYTGGDIGIYTCYNEALGSAHHYTSSKSEWESLSAHGWNLERDKNDNGNGFLRGVVSAK